MAEIELGNGLPGLDADSPPLPSLSWNTRPPPLAHTHTQIMAEIELGNGLPDVRTTAETNESLKKAGFELLESADLALTADVPWWDPVDPDSWQLSSERGLALGGVWGWGLGLIKSVGLALTADVPWWDPVDPDSWPTVTGGAARG